MRGAARRSAEETLVGKAVSEDGTTKAVLLRSRVDPTSGGLCWLPVDAAMAAEGRERATKVTLVSRGPGGCVDRQRMDTYRDEPKTCANAIMYKHAAGSTQTIQPCTAVVVDNTCMATLLQHSIPIA